MRLAAAVFEEAEGRFAREIEREERRRLKQHGCGHDAAAEAKRHREACLVVDNDVVLYQVTKPQE